MPHNFIRDSWAITLQQPLALSGHITNSTQLETEKQNLPLSDPFARPFDLSYDPDLSPTSNTRCSCPFTTVGADITITHSTEPPPIALTTDVKQIVTAIADKHLQQSERSKFMRSNRTVGTNTSASHTTLGETIIQDLLKANTILLPFAIDPHGRWGPILQSFLLTPPLTAEPITFPSSRPHAQTLYQRATTHPAPTGILLSADSTWKRNKTRRYYGFSHTAPTPSIHTLQNLGLGITKAFTLHIRNSITRSTKHQHNQENRDYDTDSISGPNDHDSHV